MSWFEKIMPSRIKTERRTRSVPEGLWIKCSACDAVLYRAELERNLNVCPKCSHHMRIGGRERLNRFLDEGGRVEIGAMMSPEDPLKFRDSKRYRDRLAAAQKATGERDALIALAGTLEGLPIVACAFEFKFLGGSMGSVVGERFKRAVDHCIENGAPLVCFSSSGGARMQEALFSLLQMSKTASALARLAQARLPFISVMTDPTTGGVSASLAMLGDLNVAEPRALIGFAGPRVIQQTVRETLPEGFQRSEFLLDHGALDLIIDRRDMREKLSAVLRLLLRRPAAAPVAADNATAGQAMRSLAEWLEQQEKSHPSVIDLDLSRVRAVAQRLELLPPSYRVVTVAGTNGKGSTVAFLDALLRAFGKRTGRFTSPHLVRYNERICVDGVEADDARLIASFERIEAARGATTLTFFEYNALAALDIFARASGGRGGARGRSRRPTRRHQHRGCGRGRGLFDRPRSCRLAGRIGRTDRAREGRDLPRRAAGGARQRVACPGRCGKSSRKSARSRWCRDSTFAPAPRAIAGNSSSARFACAICHCRRCRARIRSAMPRPRWPPSPPAASGSPFHGSSSPMPCATCASPAGFSACRARWNGFSMSPTTCPRPRRCATTCAGCRARGARWRCAAFSATRTFAASRRRWPPTSMAGFSSRSPDRVPSARSRSPRNLPANAPVLAHAGDVADACRTARAAARAGDRVLVFGSFLTVGPALEFLGL